LGPIVAGAFALLVAGILAIGTPTQAQQSVPGGFTPEQVQGMEHIIRQYLLDNPEVVIEAIQNYQRDQRLVEEERQGQAVKANLAALKNDGDSPVIGNPDGDVLIVEFMDYRCGYCRSVVRDLKKTVEDDGNIRLVMKEFPILGPASIRASKAALAADKQGKYEAYHFALMTLPGDMSDPHLMKVARDVGLDTERLKRDMESEEIEAIIRRNHDLAQLLGINGTPAFVFGETLVRGAVDAETMRILIAEARDGAS
jgi:protein-disulfide isomerase